ncbi:kinase-like protein [Rhizopogon salebrosus TDB-379]|nr:kinase-like protein [Rhizopogon salebrosus TDB-379]
MTLGGHRDRILSISYFPGGKQMFSGSMDETTRRWDLQAGVEVQEAIIVHEQAVCAVEASRDGRWVVTAGGDANHAELKACGVEIGIVKTFQGHLREINCIDISADGALLASGSADFTVRIWRLDTGKLMAGPFRSHEWVGAVRFSQDSKRFAVNSDVGRSLEVWDIQAQKLNVRVGKRLESGRGTYARVFWTHEDKTILAAFSFTDDDPTTIYEFSALTLETVGAPFEGHTEIINGLALSFDGALLASASEDNTIKFWAFESRQVIASFYIRNPYILVLSPDSHQLAYTTLTTDDHNIYVCDTPPDVLTTIRAQPNIGRPKNPSFDRALNSYTSRHHGDVRPTPATFPFISSPQRLLRFPPAREPQQPAFFHRFRKLLRLSSRTYLHLNDQPNDALDFATPLPSHPLSSLAATQEGSRIDPHENVQSSVPPEVMLQDLTKNITKDEEYPAARGGFGEIWKCTCRTDQGLIKVAVKALMVYSTDQTGEAKEKKIKRIRRELRTCARLEHKNILPVYGYTFGFGPFIAIVSPWAEKGNLMTYLEHEGTMLTVVRRFQILRDITCGLQYLHANNVIHGDFNGPNVLIHGDGTACLADFGLSLVHSDVTNVSQASWTSTLKGNFRWMAPELLGEREDGSPVRPSPQSDIYSFGGIMLQVLTNKIPYYHLQNEAAVIRCICTLEKPSRSRYSIIPDKHWHFIEQCWSAQPQERPSTDSVVDVIRDELDSLCSSHVLSPTIG